MTTYHILGFAASAIGIAALHSREHGQPCSATGGGLGAMAPLWWR